MLRWNRVRINGQTPRHIDNCRWLRAPTARKLPKHRGQTEALSQLGLGRGCKVLQGTGGALCIAVVCTPGVVILGGSQS